MPGCPPGSNVLTPWNFYHATTDTHGKKQTINNLLEALADFSSVNKSLLLFSATSGSFFALAAAECTTRAFLPGTEWRDVNFTEKSFPPIFTRSLLRKVMGSFIGVTNFTSRDPFRAPPGASASDEDGFGSSLARAATTSGAARTRAGFAEQGAGAGEEEVFRPGPIATTFGDPSLPMICIAFSTAVWVSRGGLATFGEMDLTTTFGLTIFTSGFTASGFASQRWFSETGPAASLSVASRARSFGFGTKSGFWFFEEGSVKQKKTTLEKSAMLHVASRSFYWLDSNRNLYPVFWLMQQIYPLYRFECDMQYFGLTITTMYRSMLTGEGKEVVIDGTDSHGTNIILAHNAIQIRQLALTIYELYVSAISCTFRKLRLRFQGLVQTRTPWPRPPKKRKKNATPLRHRREIFCLSVFILTSARLPLFQCSESLWQQATFVILSFPNRTREVTHLRETKKHRR